MKWVYFVTFDGHFAHIAGFRDEDEDKNRTYHISTVGLLNPTCITTPKILRGHNDFAPYTKIIMRFGNNMVANTSLRGIYTRDRPESIKCGTCIPR